MQSCCSPITSASAGSPRFQQLSRLRPLPTAAPRLRPLRLQLPDCVRFDCCSPIFNSSPAIASAWAAAPRLRPLQPLLPDCVRSASASIAASPIASASTAAPRLHPLVASPVHVLEDSSPCPMFSNILMRSSTRVQ